MTDENWWLETITADELKRVTEQLLYLNRLNRQSFIGLLFAGSTDEYYNNAKWNEFRDNMMLFLWKCSNDRYEILVDYIDRQRKGDSF